MLTPYFFIPFISSIWNFYEAAKMFIKHREAVYSEQHSTLPVTFVSLKNLMVT